MSDEADERLSFATVDELIDELARRSTCCVVTCLLKADEQDNGDTVTFACRGGIFTGIGLMTDAIEQMRAKILRADDD